MSGETLIIEWGRLDSPRVVADRLVVLDPQRYVEVDGLIDQTQYLISETVAKLAALERELEDVKFRAEKLGENGAASEGLTHRLKALPGRVAANRRVLIDQRTELAALSALRLAHRSEQAAAHRAEADQAQV